MFQKVHNVFLQKIFPFQEPFIVSQLNVMMMNCGLYDDDDDVSRIMTMMMMRNVEEAFSCFTAQPFLLN